MVLGGDAGAGAQIEMGLAGPDAVGSSSEEFAAHLRQQSADYAAVIRDANIKGE